MNKSNPLKTIGITIVILLVLLAGIPFILEHFIFRNSVYSVLTNGEWASFLGSYIGGVIGGAGTLIALWVTTNETRKVQEENLSQLNADRSLENRKERKQFLDEIAKDISVYVTDIVKYFHDCRSANRLDIDRHNTDMHLKSIQNQIQSKYSQKKKLNIDQNTEAYLGIESEIEQLGQEESDTRYKLERIENEIKNIQGDRRIAVERYFVLRIKLQNIKEAQSLLEQLEYIHTNSANVNGTHLDFAKEETQKLLDITIDFINGYMAQVT